MNETVRDLQGGAPWRTSEDARPFLLVRPLAASAWACFPISTKDYGGDPFEVNQSDRDFRATGLSTTSYIYDFRFEEVTADEFLERWGQLEGDLLTRFRAAAQV